MDDYTPLTWVFAFSHTQLKLRLPPAQKFKNLIFISVRLKIRILCHTFFVSFLDPRCLESRINIHYIVRKPHNVQNKFTYCRVHLFGNVLPNNFTTNTRSYFVQATPLQNRLLSKLVVSTNEQLIFICTIKLPFGSHIVK